MTNSDNVKFGNNVVHNRRTSDRRCGKHEYLHEILFGLFIGALIVGLCLAMYFAMTDHIQAIHEKNEICQSNSLRIMQLSQTNIELSDELCFDHGVCN
jgi:hypothetical protein